ncbi:YbaK/EbsC family protein [Micromonospora sp. L32]|uniref:YbaK/EbsC family protein n=1 Tax=Micromonospora TaxID=1873 RepID=UPI003F89B94C
MTRPIDDATRAHASAADRLLALLDCGGARYRLITHPPEGRTDLASRLRGHPVEQAAKCIVVRTRMTKKVSRYVLAVVPGDRRVDLERVCRLRQAREAVFADRQTAERLADAVSGAIIPFSFDPGLELVVDPDLLRHPELFFNAATLDRSVALHTDDYVRLARPVLHPIAEPLPRCPPAETAPAGAGVG